MDSIGRILLQAMMWLNTNLLNNNFGLTVILSTLVIKALTLPFDIKQRTSMAAMQAHAPEIAKIQKRYEGDPQTAQKKVSEYYKKVGTSPYASCLPMVLSLVFFMVFLSAMRAWANVETVQLYLNPTVENITQYKWGWVYNIWQPDSIFRTVIMSFKDFSRIAVEKSAPDKLAAFFPKETIDALRVITEAQYNEKMATLTNHFSAYMNGWMALPFLAGASMFVTSWLSQKFTPKNDSPQAAQTESMNKMMTYMMPLVSVWVCMTSNAAFALYWLTSNVCTIIVTICLNYKKLGTILGKQDKV